QIKPLVYGLFFAILTRVANHHLARRCVERCLRRMFKRRAFLDEVIAQKPEAAALRKYSGIVIHGAIFEAEKHTAGYAITIGYLSDLTVCKELAFHVTERKKAITQTFQMTYRYPFSRLRICLEQRDTCQQDN